MTDLHDFAEKLAWDAIARRDLDTFFSLHGFMDPSSVGSSVPEALLWLTPPEERKGMVA